MPKVTAFPAEVIEKLQSYVYRLIDPRNGETFYIGKGRGNRVFEHVSAQLPTDDQDDAASAKIARINRIRAEGFEVIHIIHRHGLSDTEAFHVEGALIDALPGLANIQNGHYNSDLGAMHADAIVKRYLAEPMEIEHRIMFLTIRQEMLEQRDLYEACRGVWRIALRRAEKAELVIALINGTVRGVYRPHRWLPATSENFPLQVAPSLEDIVPARITRFGFEGSEAEEDVRRQYIDRRLPDKFRGKTNSRNPVRYSY